MLKTAQLCIRLRGRLFYKYRSMQYVLLVTLTSHAPGVQYLPAWGHRPLKMTARTGASICCNGCLFVVYEIGSVHSVTVMIIHKV